MKPWIIALLLGATSVTAAQAPNTADPQLIEIAPYQHETLPQPLLDRIRATTEVFESVDGISYEQAVDLYRRDAKPEKNLVLYEEMARVYREFCEARCKSRDEQLDVYQLLLLRTLYGSEEAVAKATLRVLSTEQARDIVSRYRLAAQPVPVYPGH